MAKVNRVPLNRLVLPGTFDTVKLLADQLECSEGAVLDKAIEALAVVQSFGPEALKAPLVASQEQSQAITAETRGIRCAHCSEHRFTGSKIMAICGECQEVGHRFDPRDCPKCGDYGTGAL